MQALFFRQAGTNDKHLQDKKYINTTADKKYKISRITNYGKGCTRFSYRAVQALIDRKITQQDFTVYFCIVRNMQFNRDVTYDTLSSDLEISKPDIGKHINSLRKNSIIGIMKFPYRTKKIDKPQKENKAIYSDLKY